MGKLIYAANISLDGFLEDETGSFDWSVPDEDVHAFWNEPGQRLASAAATSALGLRQGRIAARKHLFHNGFRAALYELSATVLGAAGT